VCIQEKGRESEKEAEKKIKIKVLHYLTMSISKPGGKPFLPAFFSKLSTYALFGIFTVQKAGALSLKDCMNICYHLKG